MRAWGEVLVLHHVRNIEEAGLFADLVVRRGEGLRVVGYRHAVAGEGNQFGATGDVEAVEGCLFERGGGGGRGRVGAGCALGGAGEQAEAGEEDGHGGSSGNVHERGCCGGLGGWR